MTVTLSELGFYAFAILILFLTPGPVWVALIARALSGGFAGAWPVAVAVVLGDLFWVTLAIFRVAWVTSIYGDFLAILKWVAAGMFIVMGWLVIRHASAEISQDSRLTRPGILAGFLAGLMVILGTPKAVLFYMGVLPGFFDLRAISGGDIAAILTISALVPFAGNMVLAVFVGRIRDVVNDPAKRTRLNQIAGGLLVVVGLVLPFT